MGNSLIFVRTYPIHTYDGLRRTSTDTWSHIGGFIFRCPHCVRSR
jgi:hypothetical protein